MAVMLTNACSQSIGIGGGLTVTHQLEVADGIATVTLDRPQTRNSLNSQALTELTATFRRLAVDESVGVVVLTGSDPAFCAGLDLRELGAAPESLMAAATSPQSNPWLALRSVPQPVIGAINGPAVTGGLELALACDFLIASHQARFADTHVRIGVLAAQGMPALLSAAVGVPMAKYLSLSGTMIDATEAHRIGLVAIVVPHEELLPTSLGVAATLQEGHGAAIRAVKKSFEQGLLGDRRTWLKLEADEAAKWRFDRSVTARAVTTRERGAANLASLTASASKVNP